MKIYIDIETYKWDEEKKGYKPIKNTNEFLIGAIGTSKGIEFYENKEEMKQRIIEIATKNHKNKKKTYVYAHSAIYDSIGLFKKELINGNIKMIRESNLLATKDEIGLAIIDTKNFSNKKLKEIGHIIGTEKMEMPGNPKSVTEIIPYLRRDIEVLKGFVEYIENTLKQIGIRPKALWTTPQIAMNAFLTKMSRDKKAYKILKFKGKEGMQIIPTKYDEFLRKAYRLGRTQAFKIGEEKGVTYIDQNRQFPYALGRMEVPNLREERHLKNPLKWLKQDFFLNNYCGVCKATLDLNEYEGIGMLPIEYEGYEGYYPKKGIINGYWTIMEIREAIKEGYKLIDIEEAVFYPICNDNVFKGYMKDLYDIEMKDPKKKFLIKMLMNGLIGKFGQKITDYEEIMDTRDKLQEMNAKGFKATGEIENKFIYKRAKESRIPYYGNVMLALSCTAKARIDMYYELKKIDEEDLIYSDTDSIMMKNWNKYKDRFEIGSNMGEFKIVRNESKDNNEIIDKECIIVKEKIYDIDGMKKISGLSKTDINEETVNILYHGGTVTHEKMYSITEAKMLGKPEIAGTFRKMEYGKKGKAKIEIEPMEVYTQE